MGAKINKALDLNKLYQEQAKGKLLKKKVDFPVLCPIKYDGNYVVVEVKDNVPVFITSGGLTYRHLDEAGDIFTEVPDAVYLAERIWGEGKLGDRDRCNLKGSKSDQTSIGHSYKVFDCISLAEYDRGRSTMSYQQRSALLHSRFPENSLAGLGKLIIDQRELDAYLIKMAKQGYEGIMVIDQLWKWEDTKSRKIPLAKYKRRPTVDLLCVGVTEGTGKYEGLIGSLRLKDSKGRIVDVGSGMSDYDRQQDVDFFKGQVIEMFYERIAKTYIQPTFGTEYVGVLIRDDKSEGDID